MPVSLADRRVVGLLLVLSVALAVWAVAVPDAQAQSVRCSDETYNGSIISTCTTGNDDDDTDGDAGGDTGGETDDSGRLSDAAGDDAGGEDNAADALVGEPLLNRGSRIGADEPTERGPAETPDDDNEANADTGDGADDASAGQTNDQAEEAEAAVEASVDDESQTENAVQGASADGSDRVRFDLMSDPEPSPVPLLASAGAMLAVGAFLARAAQRLNRRSRLGRF